MFLSSNLFFAALFLDLILLLLVLVRNLIFDKACLFRCVWVIVFLRRLFLLRQPLSARPAVNGVVVVMLQIVKMVFRHCYFLDVSGRENGSEMMQNGSCKCQNSNNSCYKLQSQYKQALIRWLAGPGKGVWTNVRYTCTVH